MILKNETFEKRSLLIIPEAVKYSKTKVLQKYKALSFSDKAIIE